MIPLRPFFVMAFLLWILGWAAIAGRQSASKDGAALINTTRQFLIAFAVCTCVIVFAALPRGAGPILALTLWVHHAAFFALLAFLAIAQYFLFEALWKLRGHAPADSIAATYTRLWIVTELLPAPIALTIFITGLRLVWQAAAADPPIHGKSPVQFWLSTLIFAFGIFFWDGILGYTRLVRDLRWRWITVTGPYELKVVSPPSVILRENLQLTLHFVSWPVVFLLGLYQWQFDNPLSVWVQQIVNRLNFMPRGCPELCIAVLLWAVAGLIVLLIRRPVFGRLRT